MSRQNTGNNQDLINSQALINQLVQLFSLFTFCFCDFRFCSFILLILFEWILLKEYIARRVWLIIGRVNQLRTLTVRKLDWQWWIWQRCEQKIHTPSFWSKIFIFLVKNIFQLLPVLCKSCSDNWQFCILMTSVKLQRVASYGSAEEDTMEYAKLQSGLKNVPFWQENLIHCSWIVRMEWHWDEVFYHKMGKMTWSCSFSCQR